MRPFGVEVSIIEPGAVATPIWDKSIAEAAATARGASPELLELYGERMDQMAALAAKTGARGVDPDDVAAAVEHALTAAEAEDPLRRRPRGEDPGARSASILPSRAFDRIIEREIEKS